MNKFQLDVLKDLLELISPAEVGDISILVSKGSNETVIEAKLTKRDLSFWIYDDGASILGRNVDVRYEAESYRTLDMLAEAFLKGVSSTIKPHD